MKRYASAAQHRIEDRLIARLEPTEPAKPAPHVQPLTFTLADAMRAAAQEN